MARVKPPLPVLNRAHPLARGLEGAWLPSEAGAGVIKDISGKRRHLTIAGSANARSVAINGHGTGVAAGATTYYGSTDATLIGLAANKNFTIAWVGSVGANAIANPAWAIGLNGTDILAMYPTDSTSPAYARVYWNDIGSILAERNITTTWLITDRKPHTEAFSSYGDTDHRIFGDGAQVGSSARSRASTGPFSTFAVMAWPTATSQALAQATANISNAFFAWSRALTPAEHAAFHVDPFAAFRPSRLTIVKPPAPRPWEWHRGFRVPAGRLA